MEQVTCERCERPIPGLPTPLCAECRGGELDFVNLGPGMFGADSPKMSRRYVIMRSTETRSAFHVHVGLSPVQRGDRPLPFGSLHEAKSWCRCFEAGLSQEDEEEPDADAAG